MVESFFRTLEDIFNIIAKIKKRDEESIRLIACDLTENEKLLIEDFGLLDLDNMYKVSNMLFEDPNKVDIPYLKHLLDNESIQWLKTKIEYGY